MATPLYTLIILRADGTDEVTAQIEPPSLDQLQAAVGGYIERVPGFDRFDDKPCLAFCHEEGKLRGQRFNSLATSFWYASVGFAAMDDALVGDVVIVRASAALLARL